MGEWINLYQYTTQDFVTLQLPPGMEKLPLASGFNLQLRGLNTGGVGTVALDFLHLMPTDSWLKLLKSTDGTPQNWYTMDDGMTGQTYVRNGSAGTGTVAPTYVKLGQSVYLYPGMTQRLCLQWTPNAIGGSVSVSAYYRARRLTL